MPDSHTTPTADFAGHLEQIAKARLACIGDVMLDRFIYGTVDRISPEAPIPVLRVERERAMLGGAGNVARNLTALGARTCFLTVVGRDEAGRMVTQLVGEEESIEAHLLVESERRTTIKLRYIAGSHQLLRADDEEVRAISPATIADLLVRAEADLETSGGLVISDYGKGVLTDAVLTRLVELARDKGRPVVIDPKGADYSRYTGATILTPNRKELAEASRMPIGTDEEVVAAAEKIIRDCGVGMILVTRSQDGMTLVRRDAPPLHLKAAAREVYDVSGAGDTVVAMLAAALAAGVPVEAAAELANIAAGIVVGKTGTAVAQAAEVLSALHARSLMSMDHKSCTLTEAAETVRGWRAQGLKIGFTNGCFDLLHPGHVSLLRQARNACDRLVVGLNSDASVKRLKGKERPIQSEAARAAVLGSLASVDMVVVFGEDTPLTLIEALKPDVLVKGADYTVDTVVGADIVQAYGGRIVLATLEDGFSTTGTIARMTGKG
ncbi:MAG: D-glycero-beta-D-manno-heptose-7-phosphate kinase [Alphaproteobacteria bacterium]|nr:D-glycero-beta-D-manno-heptose-7-phosphate kinase [Alphaproteobacteria bacterium]MBU0798230.1 D-glycero-beta-D-manno-heptose-7-phosphate kinase [Alphaproteobacteria bacterium]MBU0888624.1 D-glycero-beta-D-manno-heptose-7-phosphate kinase [Alphaproteobacteria bacterium]MBU1813642.1 D-glycero-beta-D-manno-heptose-7-phosphate kinase [Alphaproteobacteria bacterium]